MKAVDIIVEAIFSHSGIFDRFRNWLQHGFVMEKAVIKQELSLRKKTLDFGCGVGQYSVLFDNEFYTGIDVDKTSLAYAAEKYKKEFSVYSQRFANLRKNSFSQIIVSYVMHHIKDVDAENLVQQLANMVRKKGKILIIEMFPAVRQNNLFAKLFIYLDRGKNVRMPLDLAKLFEKFFVVRKERIFRAGPYLDYALVLEKR